MRHAQKFNYDVTCIQKPQSVFAVHTRTIDLHFQKRFQKHLFSIVSVWTIIYKQRFSEIVVFENEFVWMGTENCSCQWKTATVHAIIVPSKHKAYCKYADHGHCIS